LEGEGHATRLVLYSAAALGGALFLVLLLAALGFWCRSLALALVMFTLAFACPLFLFKEMFRRVCFAHLNVRSALLADFAVGIAQVASCNAALSGHLSAATGVLAIGASCGCSQ